MGESREVARMPVGGMLKGLILAGMIHLHRLRINKGDSNKENRMAISMEISKLGMTFISITQASTLRMLKVLGIKHRAKKVKVGKNMISSKISTEPGQRAKNRIKPTMIANIEQTQLEIHKKKLSGAEDTLKKRKIFTKNTSMEICLASRKELNGQKKGKEQGLRPTPQLSTMIKIQFSINLKNKGRICIKKRRKSIKSMNQEKTQPSKNQIEGSKQHLIDSLVPDGELILLLGPTTLSESVITKISVFHQINI
jgi:hypothetical protein